MLNKIIIFVLAVVLLAMLSKAFVKMFQWDVEFEKSIKQWVRITKVEDVEREVWAAGQHNSYTNWLATVQFADGRTANVVVVVSPKPKVGQCLPVISSEMSNGKIFAQLDNQQWQFGTELGQCR